jgi:UPF0755 protein
MVKRTVFKNIVLLLVVSGSVAAWSFYRVFFLPNVRLSQGQYTLLVPENADFRQVCDSLELSGGLVNLSSFKRVARLRSYTENIKPGRYIIDDGISNNSLVVKLRAGLQTPVRVTFNNIRTINELAGKVAGQIEADSLSIVSFLTEASNYSEDGFLPETVIAVFIPDTYELYWNIDAKKFFSRMLREYKRFWNEERLALAAEKGLTPVEVSVVASIVDDEVAKEEEKPRIAGVYLNRLRIGMPLQACPTIKFALNDFTITRVLTEHIRIDSPYNTYKYRGLPPGPVRCATRSGIESVLNAENHNYLYFSAKADFSGYHNFSRTLAEHNRYAAEYHRELDKRKIYR